MHYDVTIIQHCRHLHNNTWYSCTTPMLIIIICLIITLYNNNNYNNYILLFIRSLVIVVFVDVSCFQLSLNINILVFIASRGFQT